MERSQSTALIRGSWRLLRDRSVAEAIVSPTMSN